MTPAAKDTAKTAIKTSTKHLTKTAIKTDKHLKTFKVAHRHPLHHMTFAKNGKHPGHVKTAKVSKPVKTVTAAPAPTTWFPWTQPITVNKPVKTFKVAHHHAHHMMVAKHADPCEDREGVEAGQGRDGGTLDHDAGRLDPATPAVKVIKANKVVKKIKVAHHGVRSPERRQERPACDAHQDREGVEAGQARRASARPTSRVTHVVAKSSKVIAN